MFYDEMDIKKVAEVSAKVREMAMYGDYDSMFEAKKLSLYTLCPINYDIGYRLYEEAERLEKTQDSGKYRKLAASIEDTTGRIFRFMLENFASDKIGQERKLSANLRTFFSRQTARSITLDYVQIERMIGCKLPSDAYGRYKAEPFWKEKNEFSKSWRDYGYIVLAVYSTGGSDTQVEFLKQ